MVEFQSIPGAATNNPSGTAVDTTPQPSGEPVQLPVVENNLLGDNGRPANREDAPDAAPADVAPPQMFSLDDYKITVPQGIDAKDPVVGAFAAAAAETGVSPQAAQRLVDAAAPEVVKVMTAPYQAWKDLQENWQNEVRNDPEIGGAKFDRVVLPTIARAMDRYGDPGLREALATTGAGNNPAIIRTLYTLSRMVTEGRLVQGNPVQSGKSAAERMYPSHSNGR